MGTPNWAHLVATGRAKGHNVPWTAEEAAARAKGVPADLVRKGILTVDAEPEPEPEEEPKPKAKKK